MPDKKAIPHHNLKISVERVRGVYVTEVEVSGTGRARRARFKSDTFPGLLKDLKKTHDDLLKQVIAYVHGDGVEGLPPNLPNPASLPKEPEVEPKSEEQLLAELKHLDSTKGPGAPKADEGADNQGQHRGRQFAAD